MFKENAKQMEQGM